jgi:hypothetical protein
MRAEPVVFVAWCWLLVALPAQTTTNVAIDALVVDAAGAPVADVEFADVWDFTTGRWCGSLSCSPPDQKAPLRSDAAGRVRGTWIMDPFDRPLLGWSQDRRLVAIVRPTVGADHAFVVRDRIVLQPAVVLAGEAKTTGAVSVFVGDADGKTAGAPDPVRVHAPFQHAFAFATGRFRIPLPAGRYQVTARTGHSGSTTRTIVLPAGRGEVDAGAFTIRWQPFDLVGEVLPDWELAAVDNLPLAAAALHAFRGRPLLVVFDEWGRKWYPNGDLRAGVAALAHHPRRAEFAVVLFDTSMRGGIVDQPPDEPRVERTLPVVRPVPGKNADTLYGSNWAIVALDADGRLLHCGRGLGDAVAAIEGSLPIRGADK